MKTLNILNYKTSLVLVLFFLISCDNQIEIDLGQAEMMIVMNSVINPDSTIEINLTRNRHILDNAEIKPIASPEFNPEIKLFIDGEYSENLIPSSYKLGSYQSSHLPIIGEEYTIQVNESKLGSITASTVIPEPVGIISIDTLTVENSTDYYDYYYTDKYLECQIKIDDPANETNYYMIDLEINKSYMQWRDTLYYEIDSVLIDGIWHENIVEVRGYEKYTRYTELSSYISSNDISLLFIENNYLVFDDSFFDGSQYSFSLSIPKYQLYSLDSSIVTINLKTLSEDYYRYLNTRNLHYNSRNDFFNSPVSVFNNINGGVGILGAFSKNKYTFISYDKDPWMDYQW